MSHARAPLLHVLPATVRTPCRPGVHSMSGSRGRGWPRHPIETGPANLRRAEKPTAPGRPIASDKPWHLAQGKIEKTNNLRTPLQAPCRSHPEQLAEDQTQVPRCRLDEPTLSHVFESAEPSPPPSTGLTHVGEGSLHVFTSLPLQPFASLAADAPPVRVESLLVRRRL